MANICLSDKSCTPCRGDTPPLSPEQAQKLLKELNGEWSLNAQGHLYKEYKFKNFMQALDFANKIAVYAEQEKHHPDLGIAWGKCKVELWTHAIKGLSENDFILAAKIDNI